MECKSFFFKFFWNPKKLILMKRGLRLIFKAKIISAADMQCLNSNSGNWRNLLSLQLQLGWWIDWQLECILKGCFQLSKVPRVNSQFWETFWLLAYFCSNFFSWNFDLGEIYRWLLKVDRLDKVDRTHLVFGHWQVGSRLNCFSLIVHSRAHNNFQLCFYAYSIFFC